MKKEMLEEKKKMLLTWFQSETYKPMRKKEIASVLQVPKSEKEELELVLEELLRTGDVVLDTKHPKIIAYAYFGLKNTNNTKISEILN